MPSRTDTPPPLTLKYEDAVGAYDQKVASLTNVCSRGAAIERVVDDPIATEIHLVEKFKQLPFGVALTVD